MNKELSLYVHFPFCKRKCYYFDFNSRDGLEHLMPDYIKALISEIQFYLPQPSMFIKSIYFGGGTPSYFPAGSLIEILRFVTTHFLVPGKAEITVEINPGTIDIDGLINLQEAGFNRLSIGLQSVQNDLLRKIGRIHSAQDFFNIFELARETGFQNIGVDLIFGLPGQKLEQWQNTLLAVTKLDPEHISAYCLQLEPGTIMYRQVAKQEIHLPSEEEIVEMMEFTMVYLQERGYEQYEISNYAKPGYNSVHNLVYWTGHDYLGFGAGATSTRLGRRWVNVKDPDVYIGNLKKGIPVVDKRESIDNHTAAVEAVMLGLRLRKGINLRHFHDKYGIDLITRTKENLELLMETNLIENNDGNLRLTYKGIPISNKIIAKLVETL